MFATTESIWTLGWKPLLQTIAILCSDSRKPIRTTAIAYLQRALLVHDLQQLSPSEWCSCFNEVLFPLMSKLLEPLNPFDPQGMEETRMRAATLLCKVFLQHLTPLMGLEEFTNVWMEILSFMEKYLNCDQRSELLTEAIPESLKNLLLVMDTAGVFHTPDGYTKLWVVTWERIDSFLPQLRSEMFTVVHSATPSASMGQQQQQQQQSSSHPDHPQLPIIEGHHQGQVSLVNYMPSQSDLPVFVPSQEEYSVYQGPADVHGASEHPTTPIPIYQEVAESHRSPASNSPSPPLYNNSPEYTSISFGDDSNDNINTSPPLTNQLLPTDPNLQQQQN